MDDQPMLATPSTGASGRAEISYSDLIATGEWIGDTKLDGIRAFARWDGKQLRLTNRNGVDITRRYPELCDVDLGEREHWFDGEIVALDGRFETTLTRDKQEQDSAIERMSRTHPCRFIAFDLPGMPGTFVQRRQALEEIFLHGAFGPFGITVVSDSPAFLDLTREAGLEGVILKRKNSAYEFGRRSKSWIKFKNLHRVTCLVSGYAPGTGSRSHFGAMKLVLIDENQRLVSVGSVGTGFTEREINVLKARLDNGEVLVVEIECLNVTENGTLRFPVYRGIRSDVGVLACTTTQLEAIPRC